MILETNTGTYGRQYEPVQLKTQDPYAQQGSDKLDGQSRYIVVAMCIVTFLKQPVRRTAEMTTGGYLDVKTRLRKRRSDHSAMDREFEDAKMGIESQERYDI